MFGVKFKNSIRYLIDDMGPMTPFRWLVLGLFAVPLLMSPFLLIFWGGLFVMFMACKFLWLWLKARM